MDTLVQVKLLLTLKTVKEKLVREKLVVGGEGVEAVKLEVSEMEVSNLVQVVARVLGKGKGTPMLREGLRCVAILPDPDADTEASDWQGFD